MWSFVYVVLTVLLSVLFLSMRDIPVVSGSILASGSGEKLYIKILCPLIFCAILLYCSFKAPTSRFAIADTLALPKSQLLLPVGIATLASAALAGRISRFPAVQLAFVGALIGLGRAYDTGPGWDVSSAYLITWIVAPLLCGALAAGIYKLYASIAGHLNTNLIKQESFTLRLSGIASLLLAAAYSFNNALVFNSIPVAEYGYGLRAAGISLGLAVIASLLVIRPAGVVRDNIADTDLDINSESTLSTMLAMSIVLGFSVAPLPAGLLFVAALTGISLVRRRALIDGESIVKCIFASLISPLLGAMVCYSLCRIIDGDIVNTLIVLGIASLVAAVVLYLQWQSRNSLRKQIISNREQQLYNARKSLSALEVKSEMTEKDLLGKLEIKRKELVDFAVGVSDKKRFMEKFYEDLKSIRALPDGPDKNAGLDRLLATMRERMYFSREMNDFYARTEVLHKDFNMRLSEAYPNLTENERKLANLLRQGFSSKYIASLMNITPKSAEINRYRLRAKLGLKRSDNLVQFIKSI